MSRYLHSRPSVNAGASDTASFPPIQFKVAKFPSFFLFFFFPPLPSSKKLPALLSWRTRCLALSAPHEPSLH